MKTDASLPKQLRFKDSPLPIVQFKKLSKTRSIRVKTNGDWELETDPQGQYAYDMDFFHVYQWHVGSDGVLRPLSPPKVAAYSHPSTLRFHPNGRFAYVSCSHGSICQYKVRSGVLVPLSPLAISSNVDPSATWFDTTGAFACVLTLAVEGGYPSCNRVHLFQVGKNGHLKLAHRIDVTGTSIRIFRAILDDELSTFTVSGDKLDK